ncbi:ion channel [Candidatus Uabimicrobium sp. HlEnr_7]|uniref:ion channel n=1 Tax=Candidatus Uabimicrobium helgolandensis TaxID=3095367 RepID=UPI0035577554
MRKRLVDKNGNLLIRRIGREWNPMSDLYHFLISSSWWIMIGIISLSYVLLNVLLTILFLLGGDCISGARPGNFEDVFFFSVQTMSTIGYGGMAPQTFYAHVIVTVASLAGLLSIALATGLIFAKFSRPTARIIFSKNAIIRNYDGKPHFIFRLANIRTNYIIETSIRVMFIYTETTIEGDTIRRFKDIPLVRSQTPIFSLTWMIFHEIDERSPLFDNSLTDIDFIVLFQGTDSEHSQKVYARHIYHYEDILFNHRFADVFIDYKDERVLCYDNLHRVIPCDNKI